MNLPKYILPLVIATLLACNGGSGSPPDDTIPDNDEPEVLYTESVSINDPGSTLSTDWWKKAVFYEIYIRSFKDSNNDGIGDIPGLIEKLDYVKNLGVTAIWLMPVAECNWNYNGYDVTDYRAIETDYGTMEDFTRLVSEVHQRGMAIIIDFPINHTSDAHPFFVNWTKNGGYRDWYVWSKTDLRWQHPWSNSPVWYPKAGRYYYSHFMRELPELNYKNPSVVAYARDTVKFWLNLGVDGFRIDAVHTLIENGPQSQVNQPETHAFFKDIRTLIDKYSNRFMIAEAPYTGNQYLGNGTNEFHSQFAFEYSQADGWSGFMNAIQNDNTQALNDVMNISSAAPEGSQLAILQSNHDPFTGGKPYTRFNGDIKKCLLSAAILLSSPGIPFIYYGEEIGMKRYDATDWTLWEDERIRTPMQWDATANAGFTDGKPQIQISSSYTTINVASQEMSQYSLLSWYRKLISIRANNSALSSGEMTPLSTSNPYSLCAWIRSNGEQKVLVVVNLTEWTDNASIDLTGTPLDPNNGSFYAGKELFNSSIEYDNITAINVSDYEVTVPSHSIRLIPFTK